MNKDPLGRMTYAKIRASQRTKRFGKKLGIKYKKICAPGKSKTRKGGLVKKGYPGGSRTRKGGPGKSQGFKAYDYVSLDYLTTNLQHQSSNSNSTNQSNQLRTNWQIEETLKDMNAIAEWEPMGLFHIVAFSFVSIFIFYDDILLLRCSSLCTNTY